MGVTPCGAARHGDGWICCLAGLHDGPHDDEDGGTWVGSCPEWTRINRVHSHLLDNYGNNWTAAEIARFLDIEDVSQVWLDCQRLADEDLGIIRIFRHGAHRWEA